MKFDIKHRYSGAILFSRETGSLKLCIEAAVKSRANLSGADLYRANLAGANLYGTGDKKLTLIGNRPVIQLAPLGSRCAYLLAFLTDAGVYVRAGCFWNTLAKFKAAVKKTHGTSMHGKEYGAAIKLIEAHAKLWTPKKEKGK